MKYGESLHLYSAPQFVNYNLEYNLVKELIKKKTSKCTLVAPNEPTDFEDEIFDVLLYQLESINLFVKCKAGEILRRIEHIERLLTSPKLKNVAQCSSYKLFSRFSKLEREIEKVGADIQALSRFGESNRIGFVKLLKKYKKWTGSATLSARFHRSITDPRSFTNHDLDGLLGRMMAVLEEIRSNQVEFLLQKPEKSIHTQPSTETLDTPSKKPETNSTFDAQLDIGQHKQASFWVPIGSLIELQVFILRSLTLRSSSNPPSAIQTPRLEEARPLLPASPSYAGSRSQRDDEIGEILFDNAEDYLKGINEICESDGPATRTPRGIIRWIENSETPNITLIVPETGSVETINGSRKLVKSLLTGTTTKRFGGSQFPKFLSKNPEISPLAIVKAKRLRFCGVSIAQPTVWATLDREIRLSKVSEGANWNPGPVEEFPYAVLTVYWDKGVPTPDLLQAIESSNLAVRISGFTLEAHAVATFYEREDYKIPWSRKFAEGLPKQQVIPRLQLPPAILLKRRDLSPARDSSESAGSVGPGESSSANAYSTEPTTDDEPQRITFAKLPPGNPSPRRTKAYKRDSAWLGGTKYWSELNDDSDTDQPFTVVIREEDSNSSIADSIRSSFFNFLRFGRNNHSSPLERQPLLLNSADATPSLESDLEHGYIYDAATGRILEADMSSQPRSNTFYFLYLGCYVLSGFFLGLSAVFVYRRPKGKHANDELLKYTARVTAMVIFALSLAVGGVSLFIADKHRRGSICHSLIAYGGFAVICFGSGAVLALVENAQV